MLSLSEKKKLLKRYRAASMLYIYLYKHGYINTIIYCKKIIGLSQRVAHFIKDEDNVILNNNTNKIFRLIERHSSDYRYGDYVPIKWKVNNDILDEFMFIEKEFGCFTCSSRKSEISVDIGNVTLGGISLGEFRVAFSFKRCMFTARVIKNPNYVGKYFHPNVSYKDNNICLGEFEYKIPQHIIDGKIFLAFISIRNILMTDSILRPYLSLNNWKKKEDKIKIIREQNIIRSQRYSCRVGSLDSLSKLRNMGS